MIKLPQKCKLDGAAILATLKGAGLVYSTSPNLSESLNSRIFSEYTTDSRKIAASEIFIAYCGVASDGHRYLKDAAAKGAGLLIVENSDAIDPGWQIPWICVSSGRGAWSYVAALFYGNPQKKLRFFGVTGTNGKTSTVWMLRELLAAEGVDCLSIGTLGSYLGREPIPSSHTTPDPDTLFALLGLAVSSGISIVAMEVSSHSLVQDKVLPIRFEGAGFTSFSRDHLDFHKDMESYLHAKMLLFTKLMAENPRFAVAASIAERDQIVSVAGKSSLYGFDAEDPASVRLKLTRSESDRAEVEIQFGKNQQFRGVISYVGRTAIENFVCALILAERCIGRVPNPHLWANLAQVPGRLERIPGPSSRATVFVDYAHTPDALAKVLATVSSEGTAKIFTVLGCGGNRDQGKRPVMGRIAAKSSYYVFLTDDNPRDEDPDLIISQIVQGMTEFKNFEIERDRRKAIFRAIAMAQSGDVVVIAGKGHESYQIVKGIASHFDDREEARAALASFS
jgi:UDP-N-acetylmuramoyl-L-alanyl-D-glutamate--2,6-diaminopimelate ligase